MTAVVHLAPDCLKELDAWSVIAERIQHVRLQLILKQNYLTKVDYGQQWQSRHASFHSIMKSINSPHTHTSQGCLKINI
jgi:hypothetical protein